MDNVNPPYGQEPQDHSPTQPFRFAPGWPGGAQGHGQAPLGPARQPGGPGPQPPQPRKRGKALRWAAGITAAVLLGAGGALAGLELGGGSSTPANASQAVALNSALSSTGSSASACASASGSTSSGSTSSSSTSGGKSGKRHCRRLQLRRIKGMYGQIAFNTKGGTETLAFERGEVLSSSGGHLVVRAKNGTTWTWNIVSNSAIRESGKAAASSALSYRTQVFVGGQVVGGTRDARLIAIRPGNNRKSASKGSSATTPSGSPAA